MGEAGPVQGVEVVVRDFEPADLEACLAVFDSNVPDFFTESERREFGDFLHVLPGPYAVLERGGEIVACGGHALRPGEGVADLCWGMVRRDLHRAGLGRRLTRARIGRARSEGGVEVIALNTSQHTEGFYHRFGFETVEVVTDGYAPGLHRHEMRLRVSARDGAPGDDHDVGPRRVEGG